MFCSRGVQKSHKRQRRGKKSISELNWDGGCAKEPLIFLSGFSTCSELSSKSSSHLAELQHTNGKALHHTTLPFDERKLSHWRVVLSKKVRSNGLQQIHPISTPLCNICWRRARRKQEKQRGGGGSGGRFAPVTVPAASHLCYLPQMPSLYKESSDLTWCHLRECLA